MASQIRNILALLVILLVAACQPQSPEVVELPTLAVLPSLTPSNTPTVTFTPSNTPTPTKTPTPTTTPTATRTPLPTATFTPSITSTFTITPTFTATATATATATLPATATPDRPQIITFTASANNVTPNTTITLTWQSVADTARIDQLNSQGGVVQTFSVVPNGQLPVSVPGNQGRLVIYRLAAQRGGQEVTASQPITVQCAVPWFFGNEFAPQDAGCPSAVGAIGSGAFQSFERGFMIYVSANGLNTVYGMQNDRNLYSGLTNGWDGSTILTTCPSAPPSGLFNADRMFNWAYCNTPPPGASAAGWNPALGWATSTINLDQRTIQFEDTGAFYIDSPVGVFRFGGPRGSIWTKIK